MKKWNSVEEVLEHGYKAKNKLIKEIVSGNSLEVFEESPRNKGWIGNAIEKDYFELTNNNEQRPDFENLRLELKITPIIHTRVGWSSKERLVLNIINYHDEVEKSFQEASFLEKSRRIMVLLYHYQKGITAPNYQIKDAFVLDFDEFSEKDRLIIEQDWELIRQTIADGNAHELSDSLTTYLGATTKGGKTEANSTSQPFSDEQSHRRAFTYKTKFMTQVVRERMSRKKKQEPIISNVQELKIKSFNDIVLSRFEPFIGQTKKELAQRFNVKIRNANDKASTPQLAKKMLNVKGDISKTEEFTKASIAPKIVVINSNNRLKEHFKINIPRPINFDPNEFVLEDWYDSNLRNYLIENKFLIMIFKEVGNDLVFKGARLWSVPLTDIDTKVRNTWLSNRKIYQEGIEFTYKQETKNYKVFNNLVKPTVNTVVHLRPSADKREYSTLNSNSFALPTKSKWINRPENMKHILGNEFMTKQEWWINKEYVYNVVQSFDN